MTALMSGRSLHFLLNIALMRLIPSRSCLSSLNSGWQLIILRYNKSLLLDTKGGLPVINSNAKQPIFQMSNENEYLLRLITSGGSYSEVPTNSWVRNLSSALSVLASPKSTMVACPFMSIMMFSGFMSR